MPGLAGQPQLTRGHEEGNGRGNAPPQGVELAALRAGQGGGSPRELETDYICAGVRAARYVDADVDTPVGSFEVKGAAPGRTGPEVLRRKPGALRRTARVLALPCHSLR
jgi:hypothetical protein